MHSFKADCPETVREKALTTCAHPEGGGQGVRTPLKNLKNIGLLSNTALDPLNNDKATKPVFNVGPSFKWRFAGGPIMARL